MTQRAEGNLIGALKKESNLTIKQALNTVVITNNWYTSTVMDCHKPLQSKKQY